MATEQCQDSVIRKLEIIGEATKQLSENLRSRNADIPWQRIAGLRDRLIHDYLGVNLAAVWEITQKDLPVLKKRKIWGAGNHESWSPVPGPDS